jgi:hypothetical protein
MFEVVSRRGRSGHSASSADPSLIQKRFVIVQVPK